MGYISNNNLINYLPLSTTQPHLLLPHCDINGNDHHQLITASSGELGAGKNNVLAAATSRWNPTPEQITTLEELYRSGTRTPTTEHIQEIASKLRKYGRIEGKNVFYWFQNHKARERLKRRRCEGGAINNVLEPPHQDVNDSSGGDRVDHTKSCPYFPHTRPQHGLVLANYNKDNNINNEDHGTTEESERALEDSKNATWRNFVTSSVTQEQGEINIDGNQEYNNVNVEEEEEEKTREIRTLNFFPVMENQEKTDRFREKKKNTKAKQVCCCNYCYYYEFIPLKK